MPHPAASFSGDHHEHHRQLPRFPTDDRSRGRRHAADRPPERLFQLVRDIEQHVLRCNVIALAKVSRLAKMPTFTTASVPDGPNGPLIPEIHQSNPEAVYIPRTGQINAWDNPAWVEAIEKTGRKTLLIAGTLTSVCMAFPTSVRWSPATRCSHHRRLGQLVQDGDRPDAGSRRCRPAPCRSTRSPCWPS